MEKMWLRLPRLLFIQKQIISRPSCNAFPFKGCYPPEHLPQGLTLCNSPYTPVSIHLFVTHSQSLPPSLSTASSNELGWQVDGGRLAGGDEGTWTKKRPNKDSNVLIAVLPEIK